MDAVTYPNEKVSEFIGENMVAIRIPSNEQPFARDFKVEWTPTVITLDPKGIEHHRTVGFLPPEELIPSLMLGIAKCHFELGKLDEAISMLGSLLEKYPESDFAPEAVYLQGVSRYKKTHDAKHLKEIYTSLLSEYPSSPWTKRASPYWLL
jgi:tetratricopeptide (TPR) repeat protein